MKKGYKAFELRDGKLWCGKVQFMPGNIYEQSGSFTPLENLLHYSEDILSLDLTLFGAGVVHYSPDTVIYEIEDLGDYIVEDSFFVDSSRVVTNRIRIVKEIKKSQYPFRFNEKGDMTYKIDYKGEEYIWKYRYNKNGHMTYEKNPKGKEYFWNYHYNNNGQMEYKRTPELGEYYYRYDNNGNLARSIHKFYGKTSQEFWQYNKEGRPSCCKHSNGDESSWEYLPNKTHISRKDKYGELVCYEDFIYDKKGRLVFREYHDGTQANWRYDKRGNVTRHQDSEGKIHTFEYNDKDEMISYKDYGNEIRII